MRARISQREARRLKARVATLESLMASQREVWRHEFPGGVHIASTTLGEVSSAKLNTARALGHFIVATTRGTGEVFFYAVKP
ncbi:MAG: hypothetical protein AB7G23_02920 [Vicinamibacterales bacterium]